MDVSNNTRLTQFRQYLDWLYEGEMCKTSGSPYEEPVADFLFRMYQPAFHGIAMFCDNYPPNSNVFNGKDEVREKMLTHNAQLLKDEAFVDSLAKIEVDQILKADDKIGYLKYVLKKAISYGRCTGEVPPAKVIEDPISVTFTNKKFTLTLECVNVMECNPVTKTLRFEVLIKDKPEFKQFFENYFKIATSVRVVPAEEYYFTAVYKPDYKTSMGYCYCIGDQLGSEVNEYTAILTIQYNCN